MSNSQGHNRDTSSGDLHFSPASHRFVQPAFVSEAFVHLAGQPRNLARLLVRLGRELIRATGRSGFCFTSAPGASKTREHNRLSWICLFFGCFSRALRGLYQLDVIDEGRNSRSWKLSGYDIRVDRCKVGHLQFEALNGHISFFSG